MEKGFKRIGVATGRTIERTGALVQQLLCSKSASSFAHILVYHRFGACTKSEVGSRKQHQHPLESVIRPA